jgi:hypothetical protein
MIYSYVDTGNYNCIDWQFLVGQLYHVCTRQLKMTVV